MKHLLTTGDGGKNEVLCERTRQRILPCVRSIPGTPSAYRLSQFILEMMNISQDFFVFRVVTGGQRGIAHHL